MTAGRHAGRLLRAHDRPATPWRNGGGVTREVAAGPADAGLDDFTWRVSLADVAAGGPFSAFPGVDRIITVVDGPGMELTVDGTPHLVDTAYEPFAFSGDAATDCRLLGGPLVDFNVMTRRTAATAEVRPTREPFEVAAPAAGAVTLVVVLSGTATETGSGRTLERFDAVLYEEGEAGSFRVDGVTAVVTVTPAAN
ncbi:HutD family protein [Streptomyces sp. SKN60]|uniref:HutD/Ves family protein n=1 Tax=Streptomyces sp. SKN60 TaxID=2855506 RepID=UPI002247D7E6|nr:HutD family protein [Streptomyces sp. SKN60]MCX2183862.1 HutD family protein [Streptomyces sp. SKN60]